MKLSLLRVPGMPRVLSLSAQIRLLVLMLIPSWTSFFLDKVSGGWLASHLSIKPGSLGGFASILTAPFVHSNWAGLSHDTLAFILPSLMLFSLRPNRYWLLMIGLVAGTGYFSWKYGLPQQAVMGMGGIIVGMLCYMIGLSIIKKSIFYAILALVLLAGDGWLLAQNLWDLSHVPVAGLMGGAATGAMLALFLR